MGKASHMFNKRAPSIIVKTLLQFLQPGEAIMVLSTAIQQIKQRGQLK
ncbi:hypothetical protein HSX37_16410|uniref:Uncharacterized protein n=1 Tax=Dendrosporobacter quercicolus TaxID=146817 RepID=A0A1G9ZWE8_9FIRM|nr:hypothetical protein [Dendrosporobacter quercicolus]NSL49620.1 hypothetical protein [Dendrosporobacter quercicolus DSM 1736]SDN25241.1 hypothetical protein SAMN04488502_11576 [Dendrosporobacter quercicolus]